MNVLLYTYISPNAGFNHNTATANDAFFTALAAADGWNYLGATNDPTDFDDPNFLDNVDVLWMSTSGYDIWSATGEANVAAWVANGGSIGGAHNATDTNGHSSALATGGSHTDWYAEMIGGTRAAPAHTSAGTNGTYYEIGSHPTTANLPFNGSGEFDWQEEIYYWQPNGYLNGDIIPVLGVRQTGNNLPADEERVQSWVRQNFNAAGSRVFYTGMGHDAGDFAIGTIMGQHIRDGILWLLNANNSMITISGETKRLHRIQVDVTGGPNLSENAATFEDYRVDMTFTAPSGDQFVVPAHFAADGDAANSGASSGDVFRALFTPKETGTYNVSVSAFEGSQQATGTGGTAIGTLNGLSGSFNITETDKAYPDFRGRGVLENKIGNQNYHVLIESFTGLPFLKAGCDSPENFFDHPHIDNTVDMGGNPTPGLTNGLHDYNETLGFVDNAVTDPFRWNGTDGDPFFGVFGYFKSHGINSIYVVVYGTDGGDGGATFPWTTTGDKTTYDVSKLDQWDKIIQAANASGVMVHFVIQESENDTVLNDFEMRVYLREMASRFGYNPAIKWNLGEEPNDVSDTELSNFSMWLDGYLQHQHNIAYHTAYNEGPNAYNPAFNNGNLRGTSFQGHYDNANAWAHAIWNNTSGGGNPPMIVEFDEQSPAPNPPDGLNVRDEMIDWWWWTVTGGGSGTEIYFGDNSTDWGDQALDDLSQADGLWEIYGRFPQLYRDREIPVHLMTPDLSHNLVAGGGAQGNTLHFQDGEHYVIYAKESVLGQGGDITLDLTGHSGKVFDIEWWATPVDFETTGTVLTVQGGGVVSLGQPQGGAGWDRAAIYLKNTIPNTGGGGCNGTVDCNQVPHTDDGTGLVVIEAESFSSNSNWVLNHHQNDHNLTGQVGNYLTWNKGGANSIGARADTITASFAVCNDGEFELAVRSYQDPDQPDLTEGNDAYLKVITPDEDQFFARHLVTSGVIYPGGTVGGLTPVCNQGDAGVDGAFKIFQNTGDAWESLTQVCEGNGNWEHRPRINAKAGEVYTIEISGRSYGWSFDRVVAYDVSKYNYGSAIAVTNAETLCSASNNNAPNVTPISDQTNQDGANINLQVQANDPNGDTLTYSAAGLPNGLSINSVNGLISGTLNGAGNYNVVVSVTDDGTPNLTSQISFDWTVTGVNTNNPPTITSPGNQSHPQGANVQLQIQADDVDGDNLLYSATGLPFGLSINGTTGEITGTITANVGVFITTITVADGQGGVANTVFNWTVTDGTQPPTDGFYGQTSVDCGQAWTTQGAGLNSDDAAAATAASCSIRFRVCTDLDDGTQCCGPVTIIDFAPTSTDGQMIVDENSSNNILDLDTLASDPLGGSLTYQIFQAPNNGTGSINGNQFVYTPNTDFDGSDVVTLIATDERGGTSPVFTVPITVNDIDGGGSGANVVLTNWDVSSCPGSAGMCNDPSIIADQFRFRVERNGVEIWFSWGAFNFGGCNTPQLDYAPGGGSYGGPGCDIEAQSGDILIIEGTIDNWATYDSDQVTIP